MKISRRDTRDLIQKLKFGKGQFGNCWRVIRRFSLGRRPARRVAEGEYSTRDVPCRWNWAVTEGSRAGGEVMIGGYVATGKR